MRRVLRARAGEAGYRGFDYGFIWLTSVVALGVFVIAAMLAITLALKTDSTEKEIRDATEFNQRAEVFNSLTPEDRASLAPLVANAGALMDENNLIKYEEMPENTLMQDIDTAVRFSPLFFLALFSMATFIGYALHFNSETVIHDGRKFIRQVKIDNEPVQYFLADFPDGKSKPWLILVTIPFWPVYLVSWIRMQKFKKNQMS